MVFLAHSSDIERGVKEQSYKDHIFGVYSIAKRELENKKQYIDKDVYELIYASVLLAAEYHDLGKLDKHCQDILNGTIKANRMLNHVDAGVAYLFNEYKTNKNPAYFLAAFISHAHHIGLDSVDTNILRDKRDMFLEYNLPYSGKKIHEYIDSNLNEYINIHNNELRNLIVDNNYTCKYNKFSSEIFRIALSFLVSADHEDTSRNYKSIVPYEGMELKASYRLEKLDSYVKSISNNNSKRNEIRNSLYKECSVDHSDSFLNCNATVGTGKTFSTASAALRLANKYNSKKIFFVSPFNNINVQTAAILKKTICDDSENYVVAENFCSIDVDDKNNNDKKPSIYSKIYNKSWKAPIVCTTFVQMLETFASRRTSRLKKLNDIAGSVIVMDEFDNVPLQLWSVAYKWMQYLSNNFSVKFIFSSGTNVKFWEYNDIIKNTNKIRQLVSNQLYDEMKTNDVNRVTIHEIKEKIKNPEEFYKNIISLKVELPIIVICNTVFNAASIANYLKRKLGRDKVEHLSTSLCPKDMKVILNNVKNKLNNKEEFILVATSCVEAGVDISFKNGFREKCSLRSIEQTRGRINRNGENGENSSKLYVFNLANGVSVNGNERNKDFFTKNSKYDTAISIIDDIMKNIGHKSLAEFSTEAAIKEFKRANLSSVANRILKFDNNFNFDAVDKEFKLISSDKTSIVVDKNIISKLKKGELPSEQEVANGSVQVYNTKIEAKGKYSGMISEIEGIKYWNASYDSDFLGYMAVEII